MRIDVDLALINPRPYASPLRLLKLAGPREHIVVVHLRGDLAQGGGVSFFLEQLRLLINRGFRNFVIDLLDASYIDARGVGGLAAAYNSVRDVRGEIKYVLSSDHFHSAIRRNHLDRVFEIYEDETSALASFQAAPM